MNNTHMINDSDLDLISSHLQEFFQELQNKRVFITGGTGFFGKWLLETFNYFNKEYNLNIEVDVLSRNPDDFLKKHIHLADCCNFIRGDLTTVKYNGKTYNYIIHAATDFINNSDIDNGLEVIMTGTKNISAFANEVKCEMFLYTSSGAVYGPRSNCVDRIKEKELDQSILIDDYAKSKAYSEKYFALNLKSKLTVARCFAFSGPYLPMDAKFAFGNFIRDRIEKKDIIINTDGGATRSYLYAADLIVWLLRCMLLGEDREAYNIGSPDSVTVKKLAKLIAKDIDCTVKTNNALKDRSYYVPCVNKSINSLGVKVYTDIETSIAKTLQFYEGK